MSESENKNRGGRPAKDAVRVNLNLATDVEAILNTASAGKGRGEKTRIVEEAVRDWAKKHGIKPRQIP